MKNQKTVKLATENETIGKRKGKTYLTRKWKFIMAIANTLIAVLYVILSRVSESAVFIPVAFEVLMIGTLLFLRKGKKVHVQKYIGAWNLLVPLGGILVMFSYEYYEDSITTAQIVILVLAMFLAAVTWKLENDLYTEHYWVAGLLIIIILAGSFYGQLLQFNDLFSSNSSAIKENYIVYKKGVLEGARLPTRNYFIDMETASNHFCSVEVSKETYKKISVGDTFELVVHTGGFGLKYLKNVKAAIKSQL